MSDGGGAGKRGLERRRLLGATVSLGLVVLAVVLAFIGSGDEDTATEATTATIVTISDLENLQSSLGHPLYWAGESADQSLELTQEADGSVYLRYLPEGTEAGDPRQSFLTVGTYPIVDAQEALRRTAGEGGGELGHLEDGAVVLSSPTSPGSVYLAYPDGDLEIEVYHPDPGRAMQLARSGAIEPVGE